MTAALAFADRVEPGDDGIVGPEHPGAGVGDHPAFGAEIAGHDPEHVEGWLPQAGSEDT
jgi:hypothetical protein